jgi:hypothetical protein
MVTQLSGQLDPLDPLDPDEPELPDELLPEELLSDEDDDPDELLPLDDPDDEPDDESIELDNPLLDPEELPLEDGVDEELPDEDELDDDPEPDDDPEELGVAQHPSPSCTTSHFLLSGSHFAQPNVPAGTPLTGEPEVEQMSVQTTPSES